MNPRILAIETAILEKNDRLAEALRAEFAQRGIFAINVVSSPGSGKTALLEKTLDALAPEIPTAIIVGDLQTDNDARRLDGKGAKVLQITTDGYCHLEANMVRAALDRLGMDGLRLLVVENVGNLVCPASHDLGENMRVTLLSVTEGEDKPLKYPVMFKSSQVVVLTKIDLAEATGFDRETCLNNVRAIAPDAQIFELSARTGEGMDAWLSFLRQRVSAGNSIN